jgi:hypothetical protein
MQPHQPAWSAERQVGRTLKPGGALPLACALALFSGDANAHGVALLFPALALGSFVVGVVTGVVTAKLEWRARTTLALGVAVFLLLALAATFTNSPSVYAYAFFLAIGSVSAFLPWALSHFAIHRVVCIALRRRKRNAV